MTQPWFDPNHYAWIPGTAYGVFVGLVAGLVGYLALHGRARRLALWTWFVMWALAVALLILGFIAMANGQPWGIWYGFLLPGAVGTLVVGMNSFVVLRKYHEVEQRRLAAKDLF